MIDRRRFVSLLCAVALAAGAAAQSGPSGSERLASADVVVLARCESISTEWRGGKVFSIARYRLLEGIKGDAGEELTVSVLGGTAEHPTLGVPVTTMASHGISVRSGEEAVLYLARRADRSGTVEHQLFAKDDVIVARDGSRSVRTDRRVTRKEVTAAARAGGPPTVVVRHVRPTLDEYVQLLKAEVAAP